MLRIVLFSSALLSFIAFFKPDIFPDRGQIEKTLGVNTINQVVNAQLVRQAISIHCINHQKLPSNLNQLYDDELSKENYVDLDSMYVLVDNGDCQFELAAK